MNSLSSSLLDIYRAAATGHPNELSRNLWGEVPSSFRMLRKMIKIRQKTFNFSIFKENIDVLQSLITDRHRKLGTLTDKVETALNCMDHGFIDVGHQPLLFGGPLFLINKVSLAEWVGRLLGMGTFFFIGDHDSIQNELTIARFPQANSPNGLVITPSTWRVPEGTPMHQVPLPEKEWLLQTKVKIQDNLRLLMKSSNIRLEYRQLFLERFFSWFDLISDKFNNSSDFSFWSQQIWSHLFNLRNDLSLFLYPISDPSYRQLILPAFEFLLTENNRTRYIETLNKIYDELISRDLQPRLPHRKDDYVPFFLECLKCESKTRVELHILNPGVLEGRCPVCSEQFSFSYNSKRPDLSELGMNITPRSDSRAVVNNFTFPLLIHIGGAGETQYYSAVIPAMKRLKISPPILIRSNRVYYSTPWAEKSALTRNSSILNEEVYSIFDEYNRTSEIEDVRSALERMRLHLESNYDKEINTLNTLQQELKKNLQNRKIRKQIKNSEVMLSHNFGRFAPGKKEQEVSWNWLDLSVLTGVHGICNIFQRQLKEEAFPGFTWYITPGKFT
ncbi:MAG: bacillithiol biosynthesis BshC [Candidatus Heimdallarchaeota archaeon]|nr:MAG: bacillithiol biosynthesis BshC [Candidatus Heimdallarchaeota archaeon]